MTGLRVLHVTDASSSGVLTAVTTIARQQSEDPGFDRVVFAYVLRPDSPSHEAIEALAGPGVSVERWSDELSARRLIELCRTLLNRLRREDFDVVHVHSSRAGLLGRWVALATKHRRRTIYSPHAFAFAYAHWSSRQQAVLWLLELAGLVAGRRLVLNSDSEERVARKAFPWARTAVLPNAVDVTRLRQMRRFVGDGSPVVAHVGRIAPAKAPELFAEVDELVREQVPYVTMRWFGEGDRELLGAAGHIDVTGWLAPEELHRQLGSAAALLFTSRGEGMPMAVLEAQAMGIPVVASPVTGIVDLVQDGRNGLLADAPAELAAQLVRVLTDRELAARLGAQATADAAQFDQSRIAARSRDCYQVLLTDRTAVRAGR